MRKEKQFKPRPGQIDFTNIRWAPVINCVLKHKDKILIVKRSEKLRLYPGYWNGISGFLDDNKSMKEKIHQELLEETGLGESHITSIRLGQIFNQDEIKYNKTWIVHPILVEIDTDKLELDWEAQDHKWIKPKDAMEFDLLPGFDHVLRTLSLID